ncbi:hypothetical protein KEM48_014384 [Puccinia striiformis f. sp. tritici PST-130]|nr:hypothetical protein KEM48_014384 [Puccinia striiformis f. sp. tritici PST-130]
MDITTSESLSVEDHIVQEVASQLSIQSALHDRITLTQTLLQMSDEHLIRHIMVQSNFTYGQDPKPLQVQAVINLYLAYVEDSVVFGSKVVDPFDCFGSDGLFFPMLTEVEGFFEVRKDYGNGVIGKRGTVRSVLRIRKEILEFKKMGICLEGKQQTKFTRIWTRRCARCSTSERVSLCPPELQDTPQVSFPDGSRFDYGVWVNETWVKFELLPEPLKSSKT